MRDGKTSVLVINCDCLLVNSSANLCHLAYLKGLVEAICSVTLLSKSKRGYKTDPGLSYPDGVKRCLYSGVTLYEKLSEWKRRGPQSSPAPGPAPQTAPPAARKSRSSLLKTLKKKLRSKVYGKDGLHKNFLKKARKFSSEEVFDYVISISTPITSHKLAWELISSGQVRYKHWIQIWEDPYYDDVFGFNRREAVYQSEQRILNTAEKVCYVSPITLEHQKKLFPESAEKMFWQPVPSYSASTYLSRKDHTGIVFGYFGDYYPKARNLRPFYEAAKTTGINVEICGDPSDLFEPTDRIRIHPRMGVGELRVIEEQTDVLVFLCNLKGGQIPGKIYQYSETDRVILFILDGTEEEQQVLRDFFAPLNRYVFCENNAESIRKAMEQIINGDLEGIGNEPVGCFSSRDIAERVLGMQ